MKMWLASRLPPSRERIGCVGAFVLAIVAATLAADSILGAAEPVRNLWVGALQDDLLVPVAALVDGKWWYDSQIDDDQRFALIETVGNLPVQWLPLGTPFPTTWQARLFTGRRTIMHIVGAMDGTDDISEHIGVKTDLGLPPPGPNDAIFVAKGVAFAGAVEVRLFNRFPDDTLQDDVVRFIAAAAKKEERTAIKLHGASSAENAKSWAALTDEAIAAGLFRVEAMFSTTERDGSLIYFVEQSTAPLPDCEVHVRATIVQDRSHNLRLASIQAIPKCDNYINLAPLAILERGGTRCWLIQWRYEDGVSYELARPGYNSNSPNAPCNLN